MSARLHTITMAAKQIGRVVPKTSALFLCDMQEKFRKTISYYPQILEVSRRMLAAARVLDIPVVVTEQYPKGLGPTVPELDVAGCPVFPKTRFSMYLPEVQEHIKKNIPDLKSVILCGIETQACVLQTTMDLVENNYEVHVLADAVSSRSMVDRMYALERMKEFGAHLTTSEAMLLLLCGDSAHPKFKEVQKLIWDPAPDSGLLSHTPEPSRQG